VTGLELDDGRRVVVKAHRPGRSAERLGVCQAVQELMRARGLAAPEVLVTPRPLGAAHGTAESLLAGGATPNGRDPEVRAQMARALVAFVRTVLPAEAPLGPSWFTALSADRLWPRPHSPIFDFDKSAPGAEWIDELARRARTVPRAGSEVVGHFDWRVEHLRMERERIVAIYDWDALHVDAEPIVVGCAAHAFTCSWNDRRPSAPPTVEEARAFAADYQRARGSPFNADEARCLASAYVFATAYSARCTHALGSEPGRGAVYIATLKAFGQQVLESGL
jgi:hypothetical protein